MKSRRNFIAKTGMAAAAMLVLRPLKGMASSSIARTLGFGNNNKLVLLHTGNNPEYTHYAERKIASLKSGNHNLVLLQPEGQDFSANDYRVLYKNNIKTGIIRANEGDNAFHISRLASSLKNDNGCQLVVCLSSLGYKNKKGIDDMKLAESSSDIDIIIGNHTSNHTPFPVIAQNKQRAEVIIHHAAHNGFGLGNIEIEFDERTSAKRSLAINNLLTRLPETA